MAIPLGTPDPGARVPRTVAAWTALGLGLRAAPLALAGTVLSALAGAAVPIALAWLTKLVIDGLAGASSSRPVVPLAATLAAVGMMAALLPHLDQLCRGELAREVSLSAQDRLHRAVNGFTGLGRFEDPAFLDRLRLAQQSGREVPAELIGSGIGLVRSAVTVAGFLVSLYLVAPWMAVVVLLGATPTLVAELRLARANAGLAMRVTPLERREAFFANLLGSVNAAKEIRLFGIGDHFRRRVNDDRRSINALHRRMDRRTVSTQGLPALVAAGVAAVGLVWAVRAGSRGELSPGDIAMFLAAVAAVQSGLTLAAVAVAMTHQHLLLFGHYVAVVDAPPDLPVLAPPRRVPVPRRGIEFRDVWFRYADGHPWVLRGVNLSIPYGRAIGLVGANGAGKSTLVKLLCRYYDPTRGMVLWDGVDIRHFPIDEFRRRISAIFQDFMHYELTAAENIGLGDLDRSGDRSRIVDAAGRAGVHEKLVSLPRGYDTMLSRMFTGDGGDGEDGVQLSGGQWQRVAIARAFLRESPELLILDEPSAGLDPAAEHEIHRGMRVWRRGQTSLLISHRLGAIRDADTIVVLDDGVLTEQGSHDELIAQDGRYAGLFRIQADGYLPSDRRAGPDAPGPLLATMEVR